MIDKLLEKYKKEFEKYIEMGLEESDALTLVEKHIESLTVEDLIPLMKEDVTSKKKDLCECKKECSCVNKKEDDCEKFYNLDVISNTDKHKEFKVTYPNGVYKYKLLIK